MSMSIIDLKWKLRRIKWRIRNLLHWFGVHSEHCRMYAVYPVIEHQPRCEVTKKFARESKTQRFYKYYYKSS